MGVYIPRTGTFPLAGRVWEVWQQILMDKEQTALISGVTVSRMPAGTVSAKSCTPAFP